MAEEVQEGQPPVAAQAGTGEQAAAEASEASATSTASHPVLIDLSMPFYPVARTWTAQELLDMRKVNAAAYVQALAKEALSAAADFDDCQVLAVQVAGGIALHAADNDLGNLMRSVRKDFALAEGAEVSLRAHPGMVAATSMDALRLAHATRVVVDYGTSSGEEWSELGRFLDPSVMEVSRMIMGDKARTGHGIRAGQGEIDLAFELWVGNPGQNERSAVTSVDTCVSFGATEVRLVPFVLDPASAMAQSRAEQGESWLAQPRHTIASGERLAGIRAGMEERLRAQGFAEYLPGLWALPGHESRYEIEKRAGCDILGFGLGAHTLFEGVEAVNTFDLATYVRYSDDPTHCIVERRVIGQVS